jgi:peroxiredoxin
MKYLICAAAIILVGLTVFGQSEKMVGKKPAPQLNLVTLEKETIDTKSLAGKVIVYNLWYVGCPPCRTEIPELNEIVKEYEGKDVVFIGLSTDDKGTLDKFFKEIPFDYKIVSNAGSVMLFNFGNTQEDGSLYVPFPTHVVVNRQGFIEVNVAGKKGVGAVREELKRQFADSAKSKSEAAEQPNN